MIRPSLRVWGELSRMAVAVEERGLVTGQIRLLD